jgi:hypothetical protein
MTNSADLANLMGSEIKAAIQLSVLNNETVNVTVTLCRDISTVAVFASDYADYVDYAKENDGSYDMWGWSEEMEKAGKGDMEWRIRVTLIVVEQ